MTRIIDLSLPIDEDILEPFPVKVRRIGHDEGAGKIGRAFIYKKSDPWTVKLRKIALYLTGKRKIDRHSFPGGLFLSHESVTASVHCGTHVDAPFHFGPDCEGWPAKTVDRLPLEWCYGDGVVLDMVKVLPGYEIVPSDIEDELHRIGYTLKPGDIVLIKTGADKLYGKREYLYGFPGMGAEAVRYLLDKGIRTIGIDAVSLDRPFSAMVEHYYRTKDSKDLWPAHLLGRDREYCHIERLANLDALPSPFGFKFMCFPVKIKNVGAAWARAVAITEEY